MNEFAKTAGCGKYFQTNKLKNKIKIHEVYLDFFVQ